MPSSVASTKIIVPHYTAIHKANNPNILKSLTGLLMVADERTATDAIGAESCSLWNERVPVMLPNLRDAGKLRWDSTDIHPSRVQPSFPIPQWAH
jgi:hypothetical protein